MTDMSKEMAKHIDVILHHDGKEYVKLRHGHWEEKKVEYDDKAEIIQEWQSAKCSVCGLYETKPYLYYPVWSNYCPNCGAIMDGGENDE